MYGVGLRKNRSRAALVAERKNGRIFRTTLFFETFNMERNRQIKDRPANYIKTVMRRNYTWPSRKPEFSARQMRNPITRATVIRRYIEAYYREAYFPTGIPENLIAPYEQTFNAYVKSIESKTARTISIPVRQVQKNSFIFGIFSRRRSQTVPQL